VLAGGLGLTLLASCGGGARLAPPDFAAQARAVCTRANAAVRALPNPAPSSDQPLPELVRNLLLWGDETAVIVFVTPSASLGEVDNVRSIVAATDGVARYRYLDQQDAKALFDTLFAGSELVETVAPETLPASFNIVVRPKADLDYLITRFSAEPGVQNVQTARDALDPLVRTIRGFSGRAADLREREAEALDDLREPAARQDAVTALVAALRTEAEGLGQVDRAALRRDHRAAARLMAAAAGRTTQLSAAAVRAGVPACGRSAWPTLMGAGRS
jgi:hypothetical protein